MSRTIRTAVMVLVLVIVGMCGFAVVTNAGIGVTSPDVVEVNNGDNGVVVTWSDVENADSYIIYRKNAEKGGTYKLAKVSAQDGSSFCDTDVQSGKEYIYSVRAVEGMRKSKKSDTSVITYLSKPAFKYVTTGDGCVELAWSVAHGADGYMVFKRVDDKLVKLADVKGDTICAYNDPLVVEGENYTYTVVAHKGDFRSTHEYRQSGVYLECPRLNKAENMSRGIEISWEETNSADEYVVYRKAYGEPRWSKIATTDDGSYCDETVKGGVEYIYTVRAAQDGLYSGYNRLGVRSLFIASPCGLQAVNYNDGISLSWDRCDGADKYNVYRKDGDNWSILGVCEKTGFFDNAVEDGKKYTYTVKAKNKNGVLSAYEEVVDCRALTSPLNLQAESVENGIEIKWAIKKFATGYIVYKKSSGDEKWSELKTLNSAQKNSVIDYDARKGEEYTYTVRAIKGDVWGSYNAQGITLRHLPVSKITTTLTPGGIKVSWTPSSEPCKEYVLYKSTGNEQEWEKIGKFRDDERSYTDSSPAYGVRNNYKLTLKLESGVEVDTVVSSVFGVDPDKPMVALTYDDGPNARTTNRILDALEKVGGRATFFIVGERLDRFSSCIAREHSLGCEIANHTYNHVMFDSADSDTIKTQINKTNIQVRDMTGKKPVLARAPGGYTGPNPKEDVGMPLIHWSLDTMDWSSRNADRVVEQIKKNVKDGDIVLMHDLYDSTAEATEKILPWLIEEGYQIVTVSEMMAVKGIVMEPGEVYHRAR